MGKFVGKFVGKFAAKNYAVVGAGWAGCAAAVQLAGAGHKVSLIEAARSLGGRARGVELHGKLLDNGQHILLGAYTSTLALLKQLGINHSDAFLNLPLQMCYPSAEPGLGMEFIAPRLPAPLHLLFALLRAKGLSREDKLSLARFSTTARWMGWRLDQDCSVLELLARFEQTETLCRLMWIPLCIAALNTPPERASAQVFLAVLRDSLGANRAASDMLIPRVDLSSLMPAAAARLVTQTGGEVRMGVAVQQVHQNTEQRWELFDTSGKVIEGEWDGLVLATPLSQTAKCLENICILPANFSASTFSYEPITTCYLQYENTVKLDRAFYALLDNPAQEHWAQFVFDRGQLHADQQGLLAAVVSASGSSSALSHDQLAQHIATQLAQQMQRPELAQPLWHQVITEKRATFACTPGLMRPDNNTGVAGLVIAGDYTASDYPATLESAVRSGNAAAKALSLQTRA